MKKCIIILMLLSTLIIPVSAMEFTAPSVPESAQQFMPDETETFAEGLLYIIKSAISGLRPEIADASKVCFSLIAAILLISVVSSFTPAASHIIYLTGTVVIGLLLLEPMNILVQLGASTVFELSEYSKLLLPVMTAALAAQGGTTTSAALYTGTVFFNSLLTTVITRFIVPALYIYISICIADSALKQDTLHKLKDFVKWLITWCLKWVLYIFTGYISITGVISGVVDASAIKAVKLTISGAVPVVGGILSDASETILLSAGLMKSSAGVYGIFAILAVCVSPFLQIGLQYLLLKATAAICNVIGIKSAVALVDDFSTGMGFVLAMTGTVCILLLISLVCFMKGMG